MASFRDLAQYAGVSRSLRKKMDDIKESKIQKNVIDQQNELFKTNLAIKKGELEKAKIENKIAPSEYKLADEILKAEQKARKADLDKKELMLEQKEWKSKQEMRGIMRQAEAYKNIAKMSRDINAMKEAGVIDPSASVYDFIGGDMVMPTMPEFSAKQPASQPQPQQAAQVAAVPVSDAIQQPSATSTVPDDDIVMKSFRTNVSNVPVSRTFESLEAKEKEIAIKEISEPVFKKAGQALASVPEINETLKSFIDAVEQVRKEAPEMLKGGVTGQLARKAFTITKNWQQDRFSKVISYQNQKEVLARKLAKASGEVRISDQDAIAFTKAIMNLEENALSVNIELAESKLSEIIANAQLKGATYDQIRSEPRIQTMATMVEILKTGRKPSEEGGIGEMSAIDKELAEIERQLAEMGG